MQSDLCMAKRSSTDRQHSSNSIPQNEIPARGLLFVRNLTRVCVLQYTKSTEPLFVPATLLSDDFTHLVSLSPQPYKEGTISPTYR